MKNLFEHQIQKSQSTKTWAGISLIIVLIFLLQACYPELQSVPVRKNMTWEQGENLKDSPEVMLKWSKQIEKAYTYPEGQGISPPFASRLFAIYHATMHDAVNSADPHYETYVSEIQDKKADPNATLIQAIYVVLGKLGPSTNPHKYSIDSLYAATMEDIKEGEKKERGIALGNSVAQAILEKRALDAPYLALNTFNPTPPSGTEPGVYQYIPPLNYALAGYQYQQTWVIENEYQFRTDEEPYPVNSLEYTADYNEVKDLGGANSIDVTPDQRYLGIFWAENTGRGWNRIAREVLLQRNKYYNLWETARLFALMHMSIADSYITIFDSKLHFNYWRPITAIRNGDNDGNDDTTGDLTWNVPAPLATPPIGEYPSAHAISGAAAGGILNRFFGTTDIPFTTDSGYKPIPRSFPSIDAAVRENSLSRIYIGYHFRHAVEVGEKTGYELADYVFENGLQAIK